MKTTVTVSEDPARTALSGWAAVAAGTLVYAVLFGLNLLLPLEAGPFTRYFNYSMRLWNWMGLLMIITALVVIGLHWRRLDRKVLLLGLALGVICAGSIYLHNLDLRDAYRQGLTVLLTFLAGAALFNAGAAPRVAAFSGAPWLVARRLLFGMALAVPLAVVNNLYFYLNNPAAQFRGVFEAAGAALNPGIAEEVMYRYFILALVLWALRGAANGRVVTAAALFLAVVPHSLNHLPDLFLQNPLMGLMMLTATSLLFGLPMAWLAFKRSLETAVGFHWFIDFVRFWFGF
jgi:hypothetical protein